MRSEHVNCIVMVKSPLPLGSAAHGATLELGEALDRPPDPSSCLLMFCRIVLNSTGIQEKHFHITRPLTFTTSPTHFPRETYDWAQYTKYVAFSRDAHQDFCSREAETLTLCTGPFYQWPQFALYFTLFFLNSAGAETTTVQLLLWLVWGLVRAETSCSTKIRYLWLLDRSNLSAGLFLTPCHQSSSETIRTHVGTAACSQYMGNTSSPDVLWVLFWLVIRNYKGSKPAITEMGWQRGILENASCWKNFSNSKRIQIWKVFNFTWNTVEGCECRSSESLACFFALMQREKARHREWAITRSNRINWAHKIFGRKIIQ